VVPPFFVSASRLPTSVGKRLPLPCNGSSRCNLTVLAWRSQRTFSLPTQEWISAASCYRLPPMATLCQRRYGLLFSITVILCSATLNYTMSSRDRQLDNARVL